MFPALQFYEEFENDLVLLEKNKEEEFESEDVDDFDKEIINKILESYRLSRKNGLSTGTVTQFRKKFAAMNEIELTTFLRKARIANKKHALEHGRGKFVIKKYKRPLVK